MLMIDYYLPPEEYRSLTSAKKDWSLLLHLNIDYSEIAMMSVWLNVGTILRMARLNVSFEYRSILKNRLLKRG